MPALLLRLLLQCAGDIKMNPGPVSTPTPTNCLRLMQWTANGISGKITELLTFFHDNNVNIATIQEIKLINKTNPAKIPRLAAVRLDRHTKNAAARKNSALRITTGCLKMVDVTELHQEARELPVRKHNELISQKFASIRS